MVNIMISKVDSGGLMFYFLKCDLEVFIEFIEFDMLEKWGGELKFDNGGFYYIDLIVKLLCLFVFLCVKCFGVVED